MKLLFIMSVGAMFLVLTRPVKGAKLGSIESPVETLNPLETREGNHINKIYRKYTLNVQNILFHFLFTD